MSYFHSENWFNPDVFNPVEASGGLVLGLVLGHLMWHLWRRHRSAR